MRVEKVRKFILGKLLRIVAVIETSGPVESCRRIAPLTGGSTMTRKLWVAPGVAPRHSPPRRPGDLASWMNSDYSISEALWQSWPDDRFSGLTKSGLSGARQGKWVGLHAACLMNCEIFAIPTEFKF